MVKEQCALCNKAHKMDTSKIRKRNKKDKNAGADPAKEKRSEQSAWHMPRSANKIIEIGYRGGGESHQIMKNIVVVGGK